MTPNIGDPVVGYDIDREHNHMSSSKGLRLRYSLVKDAQHNNGVQYGGDLFQINGETGQIFMLPKIEAWPGCAPTAAQIAGFKNALGGGDAFGRKQCLAACDTATGAADGCTLAVECQTYCVTDHNGAFKNRLDFENSGGTITLVVRVTDPDEAHSGPGGNPGEIGQHQDRDARISIILSNVNERPIYDGGVREIPENSNTWAPVGAPVTATDEDKEDRTKLTYWVTESKAMNVYGGKWVDTTPLLGLKAFDIKTLTGQVVVANPVLNYENTGAIRLVVQVRDPSDYTDSAYITINLLNRNENAVWPGGERGFSELKCPAGWNQFDTKTCCEKATGCPVRCSIDPAGMAGIKPCAYFAETNVDIERPAGWETRRGCNIFESGVVGGYGCRVKADPVDHPNIDASGARTCAVASGKRCVGATAIAGLTTVGTTADASECAAWCRAQAFPEGAGCQYTLASMTCSVVDTCEATDTAPTHAAGACETGTGRKLTYKVLGGDPGRIFTLTNTKDASGGDIGVFTVRLPFFLDFENIKEYELEIQVTEATGLTAKAKMSIRVDNVNESPEFARGFYGRVKEIASTGQTFGEHAKGFDPDEVQIGPSVMDWWADATAHSCVERPSAGSPHVRLREGCKTGFIEGQHRFPEVANWEWKIGTSEVVSAYGNWEDKMDMTIEGQYVGFQNAEETLVLPVRSSNQLTLKWKWAFTSSNTQAAKHMILTGNVNAYAWVNEARFLKYSINNEDGGNNGCCIQSDGNVKGKFTGTDAGDIGQLSKQCQAGRGKQGTKACKRNVFSVTPAGRMYVSRKNQMNSAHKTMYDVTVRATDPGGLWAETNYRVEVLVANEPPTLTKRVATIKENSGNGIIAMGGGNIGCSQHMGNRPYPCYNDGTTTWSFANGVMPAEMSVAGTTTWNQAKAKCANLGGQICSLSEICPRGSLYEGPLGTAEGGKRSSNQWVPVRNAYNAWVDIGNGGDTYHAGDPPNARLDRTEVATANGAGAAPANINQRHCRLHRESYGYAPSWGKKTKNKSFRSKVLCCQTKNKVFDTDIEAGRPQVLDWSIRGGERPKYENFFIDGASGVVKKGSGGRGLNFEHQNYYWLTVRVQDNGVGQLYDEAPLQIEIQDINEAPWGWGQNAYLQENVGPRQMTSSLRAWDWDEMDGRGSKITWDMDGGTSGFNRKEEPIPFRMVAGSRGKIFSTGPTNYERIPVYYLRARVTDTGWDYPTKGVTRDQARLSSIVWVTVIIINRNDQPRLADSTRRVDENTNRRRLMPDTLVGETLMVHAVEEDSFDTLHWSIVGCSPGPNPFYINNVGQLIVRHRNYLNYEKTSAYTLTIKVKDSGCSVCQNHPILSDTARTKVYINDLNEAAVFSGKARKRMLLENSPVDTLVRRNGFTGNGQFAPVDPDAGQTHSFTITGQPKRFKIHTIDNKRAKITVVKGAYLDFEAFDKQFVVAVRVTDFGGPITAESPAITSGVDCTIYLIDVNEPPLLDDMALWVEENTPRNGAIGKPLVAIDPDAADRGRLKYTLDNRERRFGTRYSNSIGQLIVRNEPMNYEATTRYTTTVYITDTGNAPHSPQGALTTDAVLTVRVIDVNERPNIENQRRLVKENSPVDRFIGTNLIATDPDNFQDLTYEITAAEWRPTWKINACDGQLMVKMPNVNYEKKHTFTLTVKVTDSGITGFDLLDDDATITIAIIDVNEAPTMKYQAYAIDENVPAGTKIGKSMRVALGDVDNGNSSPGRPDWQTHTFRIVAGNDGNTFSLNANTGVLTLKHQKECLTDDDGDKTACATLNYERRDNYLLFIETEDSGSPTHETSADQEKLRVRSQLEISINDVNEAPKFWTQEMWQPEQTPLRIPALPYNAEVGTVWGEDEDSDPIRFDITGYWDSTGALVDTEGDNAKNLEDLPFSLDETTGLFMVKGPGLLDFEGYLPKDCEKPGSATFGDADCKKAPKQYKIRAKCSDIAQGRVPKTTTAIVTINVVDVNENPVIVNQAFTIAEDHGATEAVGMVLSTDIDAGQSHVYTIEGGNTHGAFRVMPDGKLLAVHATCGKTTCPELDYETPDRQFFTLTLQVRDNGQGGLLAQAQVEVTVVNTNEPPFFVVPNTPRLTPKTQVFGMPVLLPDGSSTLPTSYYVREIIEGKPVGSKIEGPINAKDEDAVDTDSSTGLFAAGAKPLDGSEAKTSGAKASYTIEYGMGTRPELFNIDPQSGVLSIAADSHTCYWSGGSELCPGLDYEQAYGATSTKGTDWLHAYLIYITATDQGKDGARLSTTVPVRINVLDVNEPPHMHAFIRMVGENYQLGDTVGDPVRMVDPKTEDPDRTLMPSPMDKLTFEIVDCETGYVKCQGSETPETHGCWGQDATQASNFPTSACIVPDLFAIDPSTAQITVNKGPTVDSTESPATLGDVNPRKINRGCQNCEKLFNAFSPDEACKMGDGTEVQFMDNLPFNIVGKSVGTFEGCSCKDGLRSTDERGGCQTNDWFDFKRFPYHRIKIRVTDSGDSRNNGNPAMFHENWVQLQVVPQNNPPVLRDTARKVGEVSHVTGCASHFGDPEGLPKNAAVLDLLTKPTAVALGSGGGCNVNLGSERRDPLVGGAITGEDEDGDRIEYSIAGGNLDERFRVDMKTGTVHVNTMYVFGEPTLNFEKVGSYLVVVKGIDVPSERPMPPPCCGNPKAPGCFECPPWTPMADTADVVITVTDVNEYPVAFDALREVVENSEPGTEVGAPLESFDEDAGDAVRWSITWGNTVPCMPIWPRAITENCGPRRRGRFPRRRQDGPAVCQQGVAGLRVEIRLPHRHPHRRPQRPAGSRRGAHWRP